MDVAEGSDVEIVCQVLDLLDELRNRVRTIDFTDDLASERLEYLTCFYRYLMRGARSGCV